MIPAYEDVVRRPNVMRRLNPLKQTSAKTVSLAERVAELESYRKWQKLMDEYRRQGVVLNPKIRPLVTMVKLGMLIIDEDIQRQLDCKHCTNNIAAIDTFDPRLLQVVYCIKIPGREEYHAVDGQHTATTIAAMINAGVFDGETDWREVEVAILYIETSSKAFARKAFALINGKGKKKISLWYEHRTRVLSVRIDGSQDAEDVEAERKQTICETYDCYPVDKESAFVGKPGTFTHMQALSLDEEILETACKWHNEYFHYDEIDGSLWFFMADMIKAFRAAKMPVTAEFLSELAAILQQYFAGLAQFHEAVHKAHRLWGEHVYGYEVDWQDDSIACVLVQLYHKLGGKHAVPKPLLDRFDRIIDFIDDDIKDLYNAVA